MVCSILVISSNNRLMTARLGQFSGFVTLISSVHQYGNSGEILTDYFDRFSAFRRIVTIPAGKMNLNYGFIISGHHMKFGVPSALAFSDRLLSCFFIAPCASGRTIREVESTAMISMLMAMIRSFCRVINSFCKTPDLAQRLHL